MKPQTVHREAYKLMGNPQITARIQELMKPIVAQVTMTREGGGTMLDLSVYERYLANDDDLSPELTQELLDAYRVLQGENVRLKTKLAEQGARKPGMETG